MMRSLLNGKIHRARVTTAEVDYEGSISLDRDLMAAAGLLENERVQVVDVSNGARLDTYAIPAPAGSGTVQINGAAAHLVEVGDLIIVMSWALVDDEEAHDWHPTVVVVDDKNRVREVRRDRADLLPA